MASHSTSEDNSQYSFNALWNLSATLVNSAKQVGNIIKSTTNAAGNKWKESSTVTKACVIGSATAVVAPLAIIPALGVAGFTSAGVAAGSIAASMQTATTVSGGIFALCQSAAATGAVAISTSVGVGLGAGTTAAAITATVSRNSSGNQNNDDNEHVGIEEQQNVQEDGDEQFGSEEQQNVQEDGDEQVGSEAV